MTGCRSGQAQQWWHISMLFGFIFLLPVTTPSLPVRTHPVFLIETIIHRQGICKEKHNRKAHSSHSFFSKTPKSVLLLKLPSMHTPTCLKEIYPPCPRENQYILILKRISRAKKSLTSICYRAATFSILTSWIMSALEKQHIHRNWTCSMKTSPSPYTSAKSGACSVLGSQS